MFLVVDGQVVYCNHMKQWTMDTSTASFVKYQKEWEPLYEVIVAMEDKGELHNSSDAISHLNWRRQRFCRAL